MSETILCIGNSHMATVWRGLEAAGVPHAWRFHAFVGEPSAAAREDGGPALNEFVEALPAEERRPAVLVSMIGGNEHTILGLLEPPGRPLDFVFEGAPDLPTDQRATLVPQAKIEARLKPMMDRRMRVLEELRRLFDCPMVHVQSPPPPRDNDFILENIDPAFTKRGGEITIARPAVRLKLWLLYSELVRDVCRTHGIAYLNAPAEGCAPAGFLRRKFYGHNATHAGPDYGNLIVRQIADFLETGTLGTPVKPNMTARKNERSRPEGASGDGFTEDAEKLADAMCEEEMLDMIPQRRNAARKP